MRKFKKFLITLAGVCLLALCAMAAVPCAAADSEEVYVGGMPAGFTLGLGGVQVISICEILTNDGVASPAKEAGIQVGDMIINFDGAEIKSAGDIDAALSRYHGGRVTVTVKSGDGIEKMAIVPAKDTVTDRYKLGVLIRDSLAGIGTVTYIERDSLRFGALGHAVLDDAGTLMPVSSAGKMFRCSIVNVVKGERGKAGELKGLFINDKCIATADKNCETGIYGTYAERGDLSSLRVVKLGKEATPGKASIITTIDGVTPKEYEVSIIKVDPSNSQNKNFVLKVSDNALLEETGGIVQGMSGSPILQNGMLVGAVTHVFLNDPTRGYGVAIENMFGK